MDEFVIDFLYEHMPYTGLVLPRKEGNDLVYSVRPSESPKPGTKPGYNGESLWRRQNGMVLVKLNPMKLEIMIRPFCRKSEKR